MRACVCVCVLLLLKRMPRIDLHTVSPPSPHHPTDQSETARRAHGPLSRRWRRRWLQRTARRWVTTPGPRRHRKRACTHSRRPQRQGQTSTDPRGRALNDLNKATLAGVKDAPGDKKLNKSKTKNRTKNINNNRLCPPPLSPPVERFSQQPVRSTSASLIST